MPRTADTAPSLTSLLVHAEPGAAATLRVRSAAELARRSGARLIGLGAAALEPPLACDPYTGQLVAELVTQMAGALESEITAAEAAFRRDAAAAPEVEWRCGQAMPNAALACEARAADLVVMSAAEGRQASGYHAADPAQVALTAGRPVLVVPEAGAPLEARRVVIAWKETREARRAVADALPFLAAAEEVLVLGVCEAAAATAVLAQARDVADALSRRGIAARASVATGQETDVARTLDAQAAALGADLIVAGAYGHGRAAEWVFGGVTRDLLKAPARYLLLSH
ncbi:universal stress protein [Phenylobacterium sp.]|uniref:universal stress protein n=1 Tax=Phenylobacterium sp. TaxID=1871053 RepID=UPI0035B0E1BE